MQALEAAMPRREPAPRDGDISFAATLRREREPFVSFVDAVGFSVAVAGLVRAGRRILEQHPDVYGIVEASGIRDQGALWFVGEAAEDERANIGYDYRTEPTTAVAGIAARVFTHVAYRHPYFDGNKRTAFIAASVLGMALGFDINERPYSHLEEEVRLLTAREALESEVTEWLLNKVFMIRHQGEL